VTTVIERTGVPVPRPGRFAALVVVATPALREAVAYTLRALGARHVLEVSTVAEARLRAAAGVADLCIAEAGLPDGSGIALIRELRAQGWVRGMVLTTSDDPYSVRAAISAGVRSYLVSTANEMRAALIRTSFSPIVYEVLDFGISIYDARLDLVAEAPGVVTRSDEELIEAFRSGAVWGDEAHQRRAAFRARFCSLDDGRAAERVVRRVWLGDRQPAPQAVGAVVR
jgi:CheY-like chemotaxis protein